MLYDIILFCQTNVYVISLYHVMYQITIDRECVLWVAHDRWCAFNIATILTTILFEDRNLISLDNKSMF